MNKKGRIVLKISKPEGSSRVVVEIPRSRARDGGFMSAMHKKSKELDSYMIAMIKRAHNLAKQKIGGIRQRLATKRAKPVHHQPMMRGMGDFLLGIAVGVVITIILSVVK